MSLRRTACLASDPSRSLWVRIMKEIASVLLWSENVGAAFEAASQPRARVGNCFYPSMHAIRVSCARLVACGECHEGYRAADAMQFWVWHWADASGEFPLPLRRGAYFPWRQRNPDSPWHRNLVARIVHWPRNLRAGEGVPRRRPEMHIPAVTAGTAAARQKFCLEFRSAGHQFFSRRGAGNFFFRTAVAGTEKAHSWCLTRLGSLL